jgi:translation initiation factor IF-2
VTVRVYTLAKKLGISSKDLVERLKALKVDVKGHMSVLDNETAEIVRHELSEQAKVSAGKQPVEAALRRVQVKFPVTVKDLSAKIQAKPSDIIKKLLKMGMMVNINQYIDEETAGKVGRDFGYLIERLPTEEEALIKHHEEEDPRMLVPRAPVVTLMGHVDHGKTSLLDAIRRTSVTETEAGGITQHIGAYSVRINEGRVTFLDTPGHEAFTAMRARGANVTDVVVLVVAADDGVMPQTIEAINHAKAADVPIVVAINKIDKPVANPERVKKQLAELGLVAEDWNGKTIMIPVSAKTREGIDRLLEMLLLEAEMMELKANPDKPARGVVIEAKLSKGGGPVATILIQNGTLRIGDAVVVGPYYGKVRAMINDTGRRVDNAPPATPVEILGLSGVPGAGEAFYAVEDERKARQIALERQERLKEKGGIQVKRITLEDLYQQIREGKIKELKVILKADVQGSLEALTQALGKIESKDVKLRILHTGTGNVNESDVMLAAASDAVVIGFHVDAEPSAREAAETEGVEIKIYRIIYEAVGEIRAAMEGLLEPKLKEVFVGRAEVLQVFKISKAGTVAGCKITKGKALRGSNVRIVRANEVIFKGKTESLKRFKEDVREVAEGFECGLIVAGFTDFQQGDIVECYTVEQVAQKL